MNKKLDSIQIIGISVTTTNEGGQAMQDIGAMWGRFKGQDIHSAIPNKVNGNIYCIYTNYEGDHTKPYDVVLGCQVNSIEDIPEGLVSHTIDANAYKIYSAKGNLTTGQAVGQKWMEIWEADLNRNFKSDFELYSENTVDPTDGVVEIYVGVDG